MISVGISGAWPHQLVAELARELDTRGIERLWVNDVPGGDALAGLGAAAQTTTDLRLATGVVALDRRAAAEISARVASLGLRVDRLDLGVGPGVSEHPVGLVDDALDELRSLHATLWVGALGPRMRRLAAERADGLLLNWLTPHAAGAAADLSRTQAAAVGRPAPSTALYVRTAVDPAAATVLDAEAARYGQVPAYAHNFERLGIAPIDAAIGPSHDILARLAEYEAVVDEVVLRLVVPGEPALADALRIVDAATR